MKKESKTSIVYHLPDQLMELAKESLVALKEAHKDEAISFSVTPEEEGMTVLCLDGETDLLLEWFGLLQTIPEVEAYEREKREKNGDEIASIVWEMDRKSCKQLLRQFEEVREEHPNWTIRYRPFYSIKNGTVTVLFPNKEVDQLIKAFVRQPTGR